jgi:hypothetical protein
LLTIGGSGVDVKVQMVEFEICDGTDVLQSAGTTGRGARRVEFSRKIGG